MIWLTGIALTVIASLLVWLSIVTARLTDAIRELKPAEKKSEPKYYAHGIYL